MDPGTPDGMDIVDELALIEEVIVAVDLDDWDRSKPVDELEPESEVVPCEETELTKELETFGVLEVSTKERLVDSESWERDAVEEVDIDSEFVGVDTESCDQIEASEELDSCSVIVLFTPVATADILLSVKEELGTELDSVDEVVSSDVAVETEPTEIVDKLNSGDFMLDAVD